MLETDTACVRQHAEACVQITSCMLVRLCTSCVHCLGSIQQGFMLTANISGSPKPGYGNSAQVQISHMTTPKLKTSTFSFTRSSCNSCMPQRAFYCCLYHQLIVDGLCNSTAMLLIKSTLTVATGTILGTIPDLLLAACMGRALAPSREVCLACSRSQRLKPSSWTSPNRRS